jgi:alkanesulfonate monooxygenase SsuD/methylene tetrahydromethanopterin reductase-like flavin-dependent oxidoreductase (luciferase family)
MGHAEGGGRMSTIAGQQVGFGLIYGFRPFAADRLIAEAREAESLGFDLFCAADHLHGAHPTPEPWTALSWIAAVTERIAVMPNVLGLPYRAPAVTAKMAETLDRLSGGRLVLGLGTGGYDAEFAAFGLAQRTPGRKVAALGEAGPGGPRSGGGHARRRARQRRGRGRDPDQITCAANLIVTFTPDRAAASQDGQLRDSQLRGDGAAIAERLIGIGRAGFTFFNVALADADARRQFAAEVMPLVRGELAGGRPERPAGAARRPYR